MQATPSLLTLAAVGDILLGSDWPSPELPAASPLRAVAPLLQSADLAFGNLEGPLCDGGAVRPDKADAQHSYAFRTPTRLGAWLKEAGFDALSVANNHSGDFQAEGRRQTLATLRRLGIVATGAPGERAALCTVRRQRVRFLGFATNGTNPNLNRHEAAMARIAAAKREGGIVVVSFHGGAEGSGRRHVPPGREFFFGEDRGDLRRFCHGAVEAGADLILGHGPHVLRGLEIYRERLIAYSLGNFATYGKMSLAGACGRTIVLVAHLAPDGRFRGGVAHACLQKGHGVPVLDPKRAALRDLRELSQADFGKNAPTIADDGTLS